MTTRPATLQRILCILAVLAGPLRAAPVFGSSFDVGKSRLTRFFHANPALATRGAAPVAGHCVSARSPRQRAPCLLPRLRPRFVRRTELVDEPEADDVDDMIRSSMVTPFPAITPGQADEPNFFWSGSGDDPDAGMTYWITTTVYRTSLVTLAPTPPLGAPPTPPTIRPTPPLKAPSPSEWPKEASEPRFLMRSVLRSSADESAPSFRRSVEANLRRVFADLLANRSRLDDVHVLVQNVTRREDDVELIYSLSGWSGGEERVMIEPQLAAGAVRTAPGDVARELCRGEDGESAPLCQSVVTRAERNAPPMAHADNDLHFMMHNGPANFSPL